MTLSVQFAPHWGGCANIQIEDHMIRGAHYGLPHSSSDFAVLMTPYACTHITKKPHTSSGAVSLLEVNARPESLAATPDLDHT